MHKRVCVAILAAAVVYLGAYLLAQAGCQPQPICEWEDCLTGGGICYGWATIPCPDDSFAQPCYQEYWCPSRGYLMQWEGDTCCVSC